MKFAKQLEQDLIPEWRLQYLDYKAGKKHVKAIHRAANTPHSHYRCENYPEYPASTSGSGNDPLDADPAAASHRDPPQSVASPISPASPSESDRLTGSGHELKYGISVLTPPATPTDDDDTSAFELPKKETVASTTATSASRWWKKAGARGTWCASTSWKVAPAAEGTLEASPHPVQRLFSGSSIHGSPSRPRVNISLQNPDAMRDRQNEFFAFLDGELDKVERFYRAKEDQAGKRLAALCEQLHEMRVQEMAESRVRADGKTAPENDGPRDGRTRLNGSRWIDLLKSSVITPGPNSKALPEMAQTPVFAGSPSSAADARRDYIRRPAAAADVIPYPTAKRMLKLALQDFYRSLEQLKSYALLNHTAFRKLNKKYDKVTSARLPYQYLNERVAVAYFVTSHTLDRYMKTIEDLYMQYLEYNNRRVAIGNLRSLVGQQGDKSRSTFWSGVLIGTGLVFALQGLSFAVRIVKGGREGLDDDDREGGEELRQRTKFLLQIYGGYFLMLYVFMLFCVNCCFWQRYRINYPFIFGLDLQHYLDWWQLVEFLSLFTFVFGVFMWLNFGPHGSEEMYLWYPVVLVVMSVVVILLPAPVLRYRSRSWFAYSHWRLLLSGFYPVEFRDSFLGDIYCSLTYPTCNIKVFFCLYASSWGEPAQCSSYHSPLVVFFAALPPIWRLLQSLRRYHDTRNVFPHVLGAGKYVTTILATVALSVYRTSPSRGSLGVFIAFSTINTIFCSIWDIVLDFSLLQPHSPAPLLRPIMAFKSRATYYVIMAIDPALRFSWVGFAVFSHNAQHSFTTSFAVALLEVTRRGAWALVRVEREHCANVEAYKANRDVPLPYAFEEEVAGTGSLVEEGGGGISEVLGRVHTQDFEKRTAAGEVGEGKVGEGTVRERKVVKSGDDEGVKLPE